MEVLGGRETERSNDGQMCGAEKRWKGGQEKKKKTGQGWRERGVEDCTDSSAVNTHLLPLIYCSESIDQKLINTAPLQIYLDHPG